LFVEEGGNASRTLQQVDLPIVPISVCENAYENLTNNVDPELHLCAGYLEGGRDACQGRKFICDCEAKIQIKMYTFEKRKEQSIKDICTTSQKNYPSYFVCKMSAQAQLLLSVWTHHKF